MPSISTALKLGLAMVLLSQAAEAKQDDFKQQVVVDSVRQQAELNENRLTFLDDVVITQGSIRIQADKVEVLRQSGKGADEMIAYGKPATFQQMLDNGKLVQAQANTLSYKLKDRQVLLKGKALVEQSGSQVSGDLIRYDITKQQIVAESTAPGSRVKTIFLPEEVENFNQPQKGQ